MERLPDPSHPDWLIKRGERGGVQKELRITDPINNVTTIWRKDPDGFLEIRIDQLPDSPILRTIDRTAPPGEDPSLPYYKVESKKGDIHRTLSFTLDPVAKELREADDFEMHVVDRTAEQWLGAGYTGNKLTTIELFPIDREDVFAVGDQLKSRPLAENLRELGEFYRGRGMKTLRAFSDTEGMVANHFIEDYKIFESEIQNTWINQQSEIGQLLKDIQLLIGKHLEQYTTQPEFYAISSLLLFKIVDELSYRYREMEKLNTELGITATDQDKEQRIDEVRGRLSEVVNSHVSRLIEDNRESLLTDVLDTTFRFPQEENGQLAIEIRPRNGRTHAGEFDIGKSYTYEDYRYEVKRIDGKVILTVVHLLGKKPPLQFTVSDQIDLSKLTSVIGTQENIGWEKAFEMIDLDCKKIKNNS